MFRAIVSKGIWLFIRRMIQYRDVIRIWFWLDLNISNRVALYIQKH